MKYTTSVLLLLVVCFDSPASGGQADWAEGSTLHSDGANREYYNAAAILPWKHFMGDWRDADNQEQGDTAYAVTEVVDDDRRKPVRWDVTTLVNEWAEGEHPNQGLFLRGMDGRGPIVFGSRESPDATLRPRMILTGQSGTVSLEPVADTFLTRSTYRSQGQADQLRVSAEPMHVLLRFDLSQAASIGGIANATLVLQTTQQFGSVEIGVFRCRQGHTEPLSSPVYGIAAEYDYDEGIVDHPSVVFATGFERQDWQSEWTQAGPVNRIDTIGVDTPFRKFQPLRGRALRSKIAKGATTALNTIYRFADHHGNEPEEIYFRYYLRLGDDWNQTVQGGKLPGISGTYGRAGWGGRKSNGINGWSARGLFRKTIPNGNPLAGRTPIGYYCYHADMNSSYGTNWIWSKGYDGYLETNRWYAIEQYCLLNTPGQRDGVLRAWVDGRPAFEKTDVRFRLTDELKIEQIWMNLYHGGTIPSPHDQHVFFDNVVIAKKYIGPMRELKNAAPTPE